MSFFAVPTKEFDTNLFHMIGDEWLLICCYDEANNKTNLMTASWGGMGILWNKEVCFLFVRPQRYTHDLLEKQNRFSVCVLPEEHRKAHKVCGSQSGSVPTNVGQPRIRVSEITVGGKGGTIE